jgi:hypothetical protein
MVGYENRASMMGCGILGRKKQMVGDEGALGGDDNVMSLECVELVETAGRLKLFLESARQELEAGDLVDLSDIQEKVATLCERTARLDKHEAVIMMEPLEGLMGVMEEVSRILGEKRLEILEQSRGSE